MIGPSKKALWPVLIMGGSFIVLGVGLMWQYETVSQLSRLTELTSRHLSGSGPLSIHAVNLNGNRSLLISLSPDSEIKTFKIIALELNKISLSNRLPVIRRNLRPAKYDFLFPLSEKVALPAACKLTYSIEYADGFLVVPTQMTTIKSFE